MGLVLAGPRRPGEAPRGLPVIHYTHRGSDGRQAKTRKYLFAPDLFVLFQTRWEAVLRVVIFRGLSGIVDEIRQCRLLRLDHLRLHIVRVRAAVTVDSVLDHFDLRW